MHFPIPSSNDTLLDVEATCRFFTIHESTLYRGIAMGRYPRPIKLGPKSNRWLLNECKGALDRLIAERNGASESVRIDAGDRDA